MILEPQAALDEATIRAHGAVMLEVAGRAVRQAAEDGSRLAVDPDAYPDALRQWAASFVTLKRDGDLRGCIGSVTAWRPLICDVADNGHGAAVRDPRFPPLRRDEVAGLSLSVSVLTPPQPLDVATEADLLTRLRPRVDGLIIEDGARRALFLPAVWDSLPEPEVFLEQLRRKAGMPSRHWTPSLRVKVFQAVELA